MYIVINSWYWQILNIENSSTQTCFLPKIFLPKQVYDQLSLGVTSIKRLMIQDIKPHCVFLFLGKLDKAGSQKSLL